EGGVNYPSAERLQALVRVLLEAGGLTAWQEASEARELWAAAEREAPRMHAPFDDQWFEGLLADPRCRRRDRPVTHSSRHPGRRPRLVQTSPRFASVHGVHVRRIGVRPLTPWVSSAVSTSSRCCVALWSRSPVGWWRCWHGDRVYWR